jgi:hypothetical protein
MMTHQYKKTKLAAAILAASVAAPASAVSWSAGDWEVSYSGFINSFANYANDGATGADDNFHLSEGLLPAFHTMKATSPATNGLTGTAQITFAPHTTTSKIVDQQSTNNGTIDVREVFFNVDGSFGTVSVGRTLALFQRQSILNDMTLFGVGAFSTREGGGTTLGRIGYGYVYGDFRNRFAWKSPDINGFAIEVGMFDPNERTTTSETDTPQFQTELTYNTSFEGGSLNLWASGIYQEMTQDAGGDVTAQGLSAGGKVAAGGLSVVATMYTGEAIGVFRTMQAISNGVFNTSFTCTLASCTEAENDGYYLQGMYALGGGATSVGVSYGESTQDADSAGNASTAHQLTTIGVYHDVNSWLKVVGEYNAQNGHLKQDTVSLGGFIFW